jgi:hypothetical protein
VYVPFHASYVRHRWAMSPVPDNPQWCFARCRHREATSIPTRRDQNECLRHRQGTAANAPEARKHCRPRRQLAAALLGHLLRGRGLPEGELGDRLPAVIVAAVMPANLRTRSAGCVPLSAPESSRAQPSVSLAQSVRRAVLSIAPHHIFSATLVAAVRISRPRPACGPSASLHRLTPLAPMYHRERCVHASSRSKGTSMVTDTSGQRRSPQREDWSHLNGIWSVLRHASRGEAERVDAGAPFILAPADAVSPASLLGRVVQGCADRWGATPEGGVSPICPHLHAASTRGQCGSGASRPLRTLCFSHRR